MDQDCGMLSSAIGRVLGIEIFSLYPTRLVTLLFFHCGFLSCASLSFKLHTGLVYSGSQASWIKFLSSLATSGVWIKCTVCMASTNAFFFFPPHVTRQSVGSFHFSNKGPWMNETGTCIHQPMHHLCSAFLSKSNRATKCCSCALVYPVTFYWVQSGSPRGQSVHSGHRTGVLALVQLRVLPQFILFGC